MTRPNPAMALPATPPRAGAVRAWRVLAALFVLLAASPAAARRGPAPPSETDAPASPETSLSPAEAAEVERESEALAAEREAEMRAGLLPTPSEVAGAALDDARQLGAASPLRLRMQGALGSRMGADLFCYHCPGPSPFLEGELAGRGLEALDLRFARRHFDIPVVVNDEVRKVVAYFTGSGRPHFQKWLERSQVFMPLVQEILASHGLPRDLAFVAMIESGWSTHAYSSAAAVGPWQFIASTAAIYDLEMDSWVDERRDPVKATHAAARFLKWLHREFDEWPLAWAGYNGGPGRVRRTMNATGESDYWALCRAGKLPRETCGYVPKIMAAALISRFPEVFGFPGPSPSIRPWAFDEIELTAAADLQQVAELAGVSFDAVRTLNPELRRWVTPPPALHGRETYRLRLPPGAAERFEPRRGELQASRIQAFAQHRIRPGDTLWGLARRYGSNTRELMALNGIKDAGALRLGMELVVPVAAGGKAASASHRPSRPSPAVPGAGAVYTVAPGDTLWSISQRHGVGTRELCALNGLACGQHVALSVGQRLRVPGAAPAPAPGEARHHVLQAGETLWQLSQRYGCSVDDLKRWNGIADARSLRVGQRLVVGR